MSGGDKKVVKWGEKEVVKLGDKEMVQYGGVRGMGGLDIKEGVGYT